MFLRAVTVAVATVFSGAGAFAAGLDFSSYPQGWYGSSVLDLGDAVITSAGTDLYIQNPGSWDSLHSWGGVCSSDGTACDTDMTIDFAFEVSSVMFESAGHVTGDFATVFMFNGTTNLGSVDVNRDGIFDLSSFGTITSLFFDDQSTSGSGYRWGDISYHRVIDGVVPVPASLPLLLGAIGVFGMVARSRRRA